MLHHTLKLLCLEDFSRQKSSFGFYSTVQKSIIAGSLKNWGFRFSQKCSKG